MKRVNFHVNGKPAYVDVGENQYNKLKKEWYANMNHCDVANESLDEFIGAVLINRAIVLEDNPPKFRLLKQA